MKHKTVVANIKMNLSVPESSVLFEKYRKEIDPERAEVVVCPSYLEIYSAEEIFRGTPIKVGSQDVFYEDSGRYTGEVSPDQLKGFVEYAIVGHSERRANFGETDKVVAKKAAAAIRHEIAPIVCVGENLHEKLDGLTKLVVTGQVEASLSELTAKEVAESIIAYEPIWAIGTGHNCDPKTAAKVIADIRALVKVLFGERAADRVRIIYGGSVDDKNVDGFLKEEEIDGFLVATASLDHSKFATIVKKSDAASAGKPQKSKSKKSNTKKSSKSKKRASGKKNK